MRKLFSESVFIRLQHRRNLFESIGATRLTAISQRKDTRRRHIGDLSLENLVATHVVPPMEAHSPPQTRTIGGSQRKRIRRRLVILKSAQNSVTHRHEHTFKIIATPGQIYQRHRIWSVADESPLVDIYAYADNRMPDATSDRKSVV